MKSVLISIRPEWCELIASGKKTVEVRKTKPKIYTPFKCYIYCTKDKPILGRGIWHNGNRTVKDLTICEEYDFDIYNKNSLFRANGKVIGEFVCDDIWEFGEIVYGYGFYYFPWNGGMPETCLTEEQMWKYGKGKILYGWRISDLVIYDEPKELNEFAKADFPSFSELFDTAMLCPYCSATNYGEITSFSDDFMCDGDCYDAYEEYAAQNRFLTRPPQSWCYVESEERTNGK